MAIITYFTGDQRLREVSAPFGTVLLPVHTTPALYQYGLGDYTEIYKGQGLATTGGSYAAGKGGPWTAGIVTTYEVQYKNEPLLRIEGLSISAVDIYRDLLQNRFLPWSLSHGNDDIYGSPLSDVIRGWEGDNTVYGDAGNDIFHDHPTSLANLGNDKYNGGVGLDTYVSTTSRNSTKLTQGVGNVWLATNIFNGGIDVLADIEYVKFLDVSVSLLDLPFGIPAEPDRRGIQVYRFAKVDSGQYFYTGNINERNQIISTLSNFRYEGSVFYAQDNLVWDYNPVYRFANLLNGGYFYTSSAAERDTVLSDYPAYRYEGASFFVSAKATSDTVPVYRLANIQTGGYLFTTNASERQYAQSLGFFRDEGIAFNAPRTISLVDSGSNDLLMDEDNSLVVAGSDPIETGSTDWLI